MVPPFLYKYVAPERIDVLERQLIRFTPLTATNDVFEVRRTFKTIAGGRLTAALQERVAEQDLRAFVAETLVKDLGVSGEDSKLMADTLLKIRFGDAPEEAYRKFVDETWTAIFAPFLNSDVYIERLLARIGNEVLALSLSEDPHNSAMWAHYGANGKGFLLKLRTDDDFFLRSPSRGSPRSVVKVEYFDGELEEIFEDLKKALISKLTNWSYEKEWRLFGKEAEAEQIIDTPDGRVHLFKLPKSAVAGIVLGHNVDDRHADRIKNLIATNFPGASVKKLARRGLQAEFTEADV